MKPRLALLAVPVVAGAMIAGCGSSDDTASSPPATTTTPPAAAGAVAAQGGKVTVKTTEFAFAPTSITAPAGKLKITVANDGKVPHELVVLKTSQAPGSLKVTSARVSESTSVGEVSETDGGASKSTTLDLKPGKYVYVCNIPGHYGDGMYGALTVK